MEDKKSEAPPPSSETAGSSDAKAGVTAQASLSNTPTAGVPTAGVPAAVHMPSEFRGEGVSPHELNQATRKATDATAKAERSFSPGFGDPNNDRFQVKASVPVHRLVVCGVLLRDGIGYTDDPKAANLCRGRGLEVIDRNPPERKAVPPSKTNEAHDRKHGKAAEGKGDAR